MAEPAKAVEAESVPTVVDTFSHEGEPQSKALDRVVEPEADIAVCAEVGVTENEPLESNGDHPTPRQMVEAVKCFHQALDCAVIPTNSHDLTELRREVKKMNSSYHRVFDLLFPKK